MFSFSLKFATLYTILVVGAITIDQNKIKRSLLSIFAHFRNQQNTMMYGEGMIIIFLNLYI